MIIRAACAYNCLRIKTLKSELNSSLNSKAEVHSSFITTTVREQLPKSHHKATDCIQFYVIANLEKTSLNFAIKDKCYLQLSYYHSHVRGISQATLYIYKVNIFFKNPSRGRQPRNPRVGGILPHIKFGLFHSLTQNPLFKLKLSRLTFNHCDRFAKDTSQITGCP